MAYYWKTRFCMGNYHFVFQTIVPVRKTAADASEMVTQLLFGDLVEVLAEDGHWRKIRNTTDGYEGWADRKLLLPAETSWVEAISGWLYVPLPALSLSCSMYGIPSPLPLTLGCRIPVMKGQEQADTLEVQLGAWRLSVERNQLLPRLPYSVDNVLRVSAQYLGAPYLWGGKSMWGIDCSGFTQMVHVMCSKQLPRDAYQQIKVESEEVAFGQHQAGDLAFFDNAQGRIIHVGIVLDGGKIRHASGFVHEDWLRKEGIFGLSTQLQTHKLCNIKRIH